MASRTYLATSTTALPAELVYQVISHLKTHDKALNNCALASGLTNLPARAVQFQKCHITLENYDSFLEDILTSQERTFPLSVVRKVKLSRLSTQQLRALMALAHAFSGLSALDLHFLDWAIDSTPLSSAMRWVTKLHITCVGFPTMDAFCDLVTSFPALTQLKVYMPHSGDSESTRPNIKHSTDGAEIHSGADSLALSDLRNEDERICRPSGGRRRHLAQLHLLAVDTQFVDRLLSLFVVDRIVLFGGSKEGVWDLLEERVTAEETTSIEFSHCQDTLLNQAYLDVPRSLTSPPQVRYHFIIDDSTIHDLFLRSTIASFCHTFDSATAARLPSLITLAFEIKLYGTGIDSALAAICDAPWSELSALLVSKKVEKLALEFHLEEEEGAVHLHHIEERIRQQMKVFIEQGSLSIVPLSP